MDKRLLIGGFCAGAFAGLVGLAVLSPPEPEPVFIEPHELSNDFTRAMKIHEAQKFNPQRQIDALVARAMTNPNLNMRQMRDLLQISNGNYQVSEHSSPGPSTPDVLEPSYSRYIPIPPPESGLSDLYSNESAARKTLDRFAPSRATGVVEPDVATSATRTFSPPSPIAGATGAINPYTGEYYNRSGPGFVGSRDGTYYAPAGPNGVTNTRTGEFIPVTP